ncbi:MAG: Hsp20/alpha crystallin family protein [Candidatus Diapherotrites archaeon]
MSVWIKRSNEDAKIDFEALEELLADMLDSTDLKGIDLSKPIKIGFSVKFTRTGEVKILEYGVVGEKLSNSQRKNKPLIEMMDYGNELVTVIEMNCMPKEEFAVKAKKQEIIVFSKKTGKILKKLHLPCIVDCSSLKAEYNNNVLEIRIKKFQAINNR